MVEQANIEKKVTRAATVSLFVRRASQRQRAHSIDLLIYVCALTLKQWISCLRAIMDSAKVRYPLPAAFSDHCTIGRRSLPILFYSLQKKCYRCFTWVVPIKQYFPPFVEASGKWAVDIPPERLPSFIHSSYLLTSINAFITFLIPS